MKKISFLTLSSLILGCVPTILVSCTNDYNKDHDNFIIKEMLRIKPAILLMLIL